MTYVPGTDYDDFTACGEVDAHARGADRGGGIIIVDGGGADAFVPGTGCGGGFDVGAEPDPWGGGMPAAALHLIALHDTAEGVRLGAG